MKLSWILPVYIFSGYVLSYQFYCRCECNGNSITRAIDKCGDCKKEFCLKYIKCTSDDGNGTPNSAPEENILLDCFHKESTKEAIIIYGFCIIVLALIGYSLI